MICPICSCPTAPCLCPQAGTLAGYRAEMAARLVAFTSMSQDPRAADAERAAWEERLLDCEATLHDMDTDPLGYMAMILGSLNYKLREQTSRFTQ